MRGSPSSLPEIKNYPSGDTSDLTESYLQTEPKNRFLILVPLLDSYSSSRMQLSLECTYSWFVCSGCTRISLISSPSSSLLCILKWLSATKSPYRNAISHTEIVPLESPTNNLPLSLKVMQLGCLCMSLELTVVDTFRPKLVYVLLVT